jgi:hypothetical protein
MPIAIPPGSGTSMFGFYRFIRSAVTILEETEPSAERVNFMMEAQDRSLTLDFEEILELVRAEYVTEGKQQSADLLGCVYAEDKRRPALQAADLAAWVVRRAYDGDIPDYEKKLGAQSLLVKGWKRELPDALTVEFGLGLTSALQVDRGRRQRPCPSSEDAL